MVFIETAGKSPSQFPPRKRGLVTIPTEVSGSSPPQLVKPSNPKSEGPVTGTNVPQEVPYPYGNDPQKPTPDSVPRIEPTDFPIIQLTNPLKPIYIGPPLQGFSGINPLPNPLIGGTRYDPIPYEESPFGRPTILPKPVMGGKLPLSFLI